jgi:hypothetical protein
MNGREPLERTVDMQIGTMNETKGSQDDSLQKERKNPKNPTEAVRGTRLQRLEYYDFIGLNNPLSGTLSAVVNEPPFLPWHGKINCFEQHSGTHDPTLF